MDFTNFIDHLARTPLSEVLKFAAVLTVIRLALYPYLRKVAAHMRFGPYMVAKFLNEMLDAFVYAGIFVFMLIRPFMVQAFLIPSGSMVSTLNVHDMVVANKAVFRYSNPKVGDIIVFRPPARAVIDPKQIDETGEVTVDYIKRCVGLEGDVVEIRDNVLYRNGVRIDEPYIHFTRALDPAGENFREFTADEMRTRDRIDFKLVNYKGRTIPVQYNESGVNDPSRMSVAPEFRISDPEEMRVIRELPPAPIPKGCLLMFGDNRNNSYDGRAWGVITRESVIGRCEAIWLPVSRIQMTPSNPGKR